MPKERGQLWCSFRKAWRAKGKRLSAALEVSSLKPGLAPGNDQAVAVDHFDARPGPNEVGPARLRALVPVATRAVQVEGGAVAHSS